MKVKRYVLLKENSALMEEKFMLLSLNSLMFVVFEKRQRTKKIFFCTFAKSSAKDTRAMSSCLLGLLVHRCTRANFSQNLLLINLFMYAIVLTAVLHIPYILLITKISFISIIYLKHLITVIVCLLITRNIKIHLTPNFRLLYISNHKW